MKKYATLASLWVAATLAASVAAQAGEAGWLQFRGPHGGNASPGNLPPVEWSEGRNVVWKVALPGVGRSSPVALGDRLWLTTALAEGVRRTRIGPDDMQTAEHVILKALCVEQASGRVMWETQLFEVDKPDPVHWNNSWATPTPVVEEGRLYCDFGTFGTACLEARNGEVVWKRRLPLDHQVGPGSSPVLCDNLLILIRDGRDAQYVTALNKSTGETAWKTDRPPIQTGSGNLKKSFSTPAIFSAAGRRQLAVPGAHWIVSYDPASGKEIWRLRHGQGFSIGACPVFGNGLVFFSTGCMRAELYAVRPDGEGDVSATHVAWKSPRQVPVMSSPLLVGAELYWVSDGGMATCAEARTGNVLWQERLTGGHLASPLQAEGRIYFFGQAGNTTVAKAARKFERLAENTLQGTVVATPAIEGRSLFLRTDTHLYRLEKR